ncbi:MAG: hypothetical protein CL846_01735 [Crocinitomicaceae bacterium]|nr:hypothetical protein [Crocinitomicaceae bacterium]
MKKILLILLLISIVNQYKCQNFELAPDEYFKNKNYLNAFVGYKMLFHEEPKKINLLKKIGNCILKSNIDRNKASKYFIDYLKVKPKDKEVWISLCNSYLYGYQFNQAREAIDNYILNNGKNKKLIISKLNQIETVEKLYNSNYNISIKNLGNKVNSSNMETCPFIDVNEKFIVYCSNKEGSKGHLQLNGSYNSDLYISRYNGMFFQKNKSLKTLNSTNNERIIGIDEKGSFIYYKSENQFIKSTNPIIMQAKKRGFNYKKKQTYRDLNIDSKIIVNYLYLNDEHNKCFISGKEHNEKNKAKIYELKKLPNGKWGNAKQTQEINLAGNNISPYFHKETNTLYFASDNELGMGGYDIYKSTYNFNSKSWSSPKNMGYPVNSPYNENNISFNHEGNRAFISSIRPGGVGDYDIYQLDFLDKRVNKAVFIVEIINQKNDKKIFDAEIEIFNDHNILIGQYLPNNISGNFSLILERGNYKLNCIVDGKTLLKKELTVSDFDTKKENKKLKLLIEQ